MALDLQKLELVFDAFFSDPEVEERFWDWYASKKEQNNTQHNKKEDWSPDWKGDPDDPQRWKGW
jgi:hypothetical protein